MDTNILYAGLYSSQGASHQVLRAIADKRVRMVLSTTLLFEYEDVLKRKQSELGISGRAINGLLNSLCLLSEHQKIWFLWRPCLSDPKDDHILELAVAAGVEIIVSHNVRDFNEASQFGIKVLTPKLFLETIS